MASQPIVLEIDKLRTTSGTVLNLDSLLPSAITPTGSVLTWTSSGFANDSTFAEITYVDGLHNAVIGGATTASDTLGKAEGLINQNTTDIGTTQSDLLNKANSPSADSLADEVLRFVGGNLVNDNTFATKSYVTTEVATAKNDILGGAAPAYDTLLEIQNELQSNDTDISNILTTMSTKAPLPTVDTGATEVLAWRSGAWVNDTTFAQTSYVNTEITNLVGGAATSYDTLGKIEGVIVAMDAAYQAADSNLQTAINTEVTDRQNADTAIVGGATINFDTLGKIEGEIGALTTYVNTEVADLKTEILGGASGAYDTLLEIENHIITNASDIGTLLTTMGTKAPMPPPTVAGEVLTFDGTNFQKDTTFAQQSVVDTKAPKPPNGIAAGEFLRWDEVNEVFTFATPATGSSGTTIPTPSATTDTTTAGSTEVLIWDNTAGDLKNIASPFVEKPAVSSAGEYLSWNGTSLVNSTPAGGSATPPAQTSVNTFLYHDGTNWQYGTPSVASGSGTTVTSGVVQAVNNTTTGGEALSGSGYSSKGYASITTQLVNSMVLFMTSGTPQVNGEAHMYVHWRYRDSPASPWSAYQDTGKILMRIAESYTLSEPREGAIAIHAPMRPAGAEIEYRVYFRVVAGTIYYPDNSVVSQLTNMTLMEVAI